MKLVIQIVVTCTECGREIIVFNNGEVEGNPLNGWKPLNGERIGWLCPKHEE